jgi:hypothetical protein
MHCLLEDVAFKELRFYLGGVYIAATRIRTM